MKKQVDKSHYRFSDYMTKQRWFSLWHQIDEVLKLGPKTVLEIGPGPGIFKGTISALGIKVETLDIDPELNPDHLGSILEMPFKDKAFDVVCAFQVLEHLPFEKSLLGFKEMVRVAREGVLISLPDARTLWPFSLHVPKVGVVRFSLPKPFLRRSNNRFNGEHYWEINRVGFNLPLVLETFKKVDPDFDFVRTFRVHENSYHRFFVFHRRHEKASC